jgi:hypothetical protein
LPSMPDRWEGSGGSEFVSPFEVRLAAYAG